MTHLGVCSLRLGDGAVKGGACGESLGQALIDSAQLLREDTDVMLQPLLFLFLLLDLSVQLIPLRAKLLDT